MRSMSLDSLLTIVSSTWKLKESQIKALGENTLLFVPQSWERYPPLEIWISFFVQLAEVLEAIERILVQAISAVEIPALLRVHSI